MTSIINSGIPKYQKGTANGVAELGGAGTVPASQLPSYVDDVEEYANLASFPATGETSKIYTAIDTGKIYRWTGSIYVEISASQYETDPEIEAAYNNQVDVVSQLEAETGSSTTVRRWTAERVRQAAAAVGNTAIPAWAQYSDTQYTQASPFVLSAGVEVTLPNNAGSVIDTYMPSGLQFYNGSTQRITPGGIGETYSLRISFTCDSATNNNNVVIRLNIGGAQGVILKRIIGLRLGTNVTYDISTTNAIYALGTFVANGGEVTIEAQDNNTEIYDVSYYIVRNNGANIDIPDAPTDGNTYGRRLGAWEAISSGGSIDQVTEDIVESSWTGNTDYQYSVPFTGAQVGDIFDVQPDEDVYAAINASNTFWAGYGYCAVAGTAICICRIGSFINVPSNSIFTASKLSQ